MKHGRLILAVVLAAVGLSCSREGWLNFIFPLEGTLSVVFVNETPYKISTYWGTYNALDSTQGIVINKLDLAGGGQSQQPTQATTTRDLDVAGSALRQAAELAQRNNLTLPDNFTPSDITDNISFVSETDNTTVVGTAPGARFYLGVQYVGNDFVEIHFKQVPGTTDQFTVVMNATPQ